MSLAHARTLRYGGGRVNGLMPFPPPLFLVIFLRARDHLLHFYHSKPGVEVGSRLLDLYHVLWDMCFDLVVLSFGPAALWVGIFRTAIWPSDGHGCTCHKDLQFEVLSAGRGVAQNPLSISL